MAHGSSHRCRGIRGGESNSSVFLTRSRDVRLALTFVVGSQRHRGSIKPACRVPQRFTRPAVLPLAKPSISSTVAMLKSPRIVCFQHDAAMANSRASAGSLPVQHP